MQIVFKADGRVNTFTIIYKKRLFTVRWRIAFLCGLHAFFCWLTGLLRRLKFGPRSRPCRICARSVGYNLPFALVYKSAKHFNIAFLYFYDHLQGEIRDTITWSFFSKPLVTQSGSIQILKLAPKAFHSCKHVQTSAYSSIAARIVLYLY